MSDNAAVAAARTIVAIIGAGPAGLASARYLHAAGFAPVLFDQSDGVGGQWRVGGGYSSMWSGMHTNTTCITTAFSDVPHPPGTPAYPCAEAIGDYLEQYADRFALRRDARFQTTVELVERAPNAHGYTVRSRDTNGTVREEWFSHVVVATGRHRTARTPPVEGLSGFTGVGGVTHTAAYRGADAFRGQRVLVVGHSVSAVEIASDLALRGAARVTVTARRHRYVLQRMPGGVPMDHVVYTRGAGMAWEHLPAEHTSAWLKALILRTSGHPEQFGALAYADDVLEAGFTHSPFYMELVAEGRIATRPWLSHVNGETVHFVDGSTEEVDAILFATGFALDLPFLGPQLRAALRPDASHLDLHHHTFHPELDGFACAGLYEHGGPFFSTIENQARWIAYTWGGVHAAPSRSDMEAGVAAAQALRDRPLVVRSHIIARLFAREAGIEPDLQQWPTLARALLYGPQSPASFRLTGPDALPDAATRVHDDAAAFLAVTDGRFLDHEIHALQAIAAARTVEHEADGFAAFVAGLETRGS